MFKDRRVTSRKWMLDWVASQPMTRCNSKNCSGLKREIRRMERQNGKEYIRSAAYQH